jgi:hypothetical protein
MNVPKHLSLPIQWLTFFFICLGLGYPVLNRFDPTTVEGCSDSLQYHRLVSGEVDPSVGHQLRTRVLLPWVARPFDSIAQGRVGTWNPIAFGLLVASALFTATGVLILLSIGKACVPSPQTAFAGSLLYLLNFAVSSKQLGCSLVDSGEACLMLALFGVLFSRRFYLLPIVGVVGALAKETFVPMAAAAALGWAIAEWRRGRWKLPETWWVSGMVFVGFATLVLIQSSVYGHRVWPWQFAAELRITEVGLLSGLIGCIADRQFWYVFAWLLPLGVVRFRSLPTEWIAASLGGAAAALAMCAWNNGEGTGAYTIFNAIGPALSVSAAQLLGAQASGGQKDDAQP